MDRAEKAAQQWAREYPDLVTGPMVLLGRLGEARERILRNHLAPLFDAAGLHPGEFDVLATLRRSGSPYTLSPTELYNTAMISSGSMTNRINRLQKAGLIERCRNPEDGRSSLVVLSESGLSLIDRLIGAHVENQRDAVGNLSEDEQHQLSDLLKKLLNNTE